MLNSGLIVIPSTNQIESKELNPDIYVSFCNQQGDVDIEKPLYSFLEKILNKIEVEAHNFADEKNEGIIITMLDINIDEGFGKINSKISY